MNTELNRVARGPSVRFEPNACGTIDVSLSCWRQKANGDAEDIAIQFEKLTVEQVACIGRNARVAIWKAKQKAVERMDAAYNRIITPGE